MRSTSEVPFSGGVPKSGAACAPDADCAKGSFCEFAAGTCPRRFAPPGETKCWMVQRCSPHGGRSLSPIGWHLFPPRSKRPSPPISRIEMNTTGPPLSALVADALNFFFEGDIRDTVAALLIAECGSWLPESSSPDLIERIRLAVLKLAAGDETSLWALAKCDWRDVLVYAGFGDDLVAHVKWARAISSWTFTVEEVSACVYEGVATDRLGRSARFQGTDPNELRRQFRKMAMDLCWRPK